MSIGSLQRRSVRGAVTVLAVLLLVAGTSLASVYNWTGTSGNAWNNSGNWGGTGYPNAYTDQATIPSAGANRPVELNNTALVGGATTALTLSGASSGSTSVSLDISSTGLLGMQGGISIGSRRQLTIEGTLRNDAASSATSYAIAGSPILAGGTISSLNGGSWTLTNGVLGYGTISAPFTLPSTGTVNANVANQTLHVTGDVTLNAQRGLGGGSANYVAGALLSIEGGTITGGNGGNGIDNYNSTSLRGHFDGVTLYNDSAFHGDYNYYNLTGNSTWNNGALNIMKFNGFRLDATGAITNFANVGNYVNVDTGALNNPGAATTTISNGGFITLGGGSITSTGGGSVSFSTNVRGYGTVSAPVVTLPSGGISAANGTLTITSSVFLNGSANMSSGTGLAAIALAGANISSGGLTRFTDSSTVSGYGVVSAPFDNNGKVIGDGGGLDSRVLDFSTSTAVVPGTNAGGWGWYAQNHGKVILPSVAVSASTSYNWGGNPAAQGMVNSVGMTFTNVATPGALAIALLSADRTDVPAGLTDPIGVWSFAPGALQFDSVAMTFRYNDAAAAAMSLDESSLKLYGFDGTNWVQIPTGAVDTTNHLITTAGGLSSFYQQCAVAVPEPTTLSVLVLGGLALLRRRFRK